LLRKSLNPSKPYSDNIRVDEICENARDLFGLSSNLYGIYQVEHLKYTPKKEEKTYSAYWEEGHIPLPSSEILFEIDSNSAPIYFSLFDLHRVLFPIDNKPSEEKVPVLKEGKKKMEKQIILKQIEGEISVKHYPTNCNFWHFELEVKEEGGKIIKRKNVKTEDWKDEAAKSFIKLTLKEIGQRSININEVDIISKELYINHSSNAISPSLAAI
jgi:hypothetical protein